MDIQQLVQEAIAAADNPEHVWDRKAIEWPHLTPESVVFEVGSYKGRWALQIARRYNPRLYCFEPQSWAREVTAAVLADYNAQVFGFGLGDHDGSLNMGEFGTDGCSFLASTRETGTGQLRDIAEVLPEIGVSHIDLMLVNVEGYEHVLLPYMLSQGIAPDILMVQCHETGNYGCSDLWHLLGMEYDPLWSFGSVLSAWKRKKPLVRRPFVRA